MRFRDQLCLDLFLVGSPHLDSIGFAFLHHCKTRKERLWREPYCCRFTACSNKGEQNRGY